jgi:hypothetical protein
MLLIFIAVCLVLTLFALFFFCQLL